MGKILKYKVLMFKYLKNTISGHVRALSHKSKLVCWPLNYSKTLSSADSRLAISDNNLKIAFLGILEQ